MTLRTRIESAGGKAPPVTPPNPPLASAGWLHRHPWKTRGGKTKHLTKHRQNSIVSLASSKPYSAMDRREKEQNHIKKLSPTHNLEARFCKNAGRTPHSFRVILDTSQRMGPRPSRGQVLKQHVGDEEKNNRVHFPRCTPLRSGIYHAMNAT